MISLLSSYFIKESAKIIEQQKLEIETLKLENADFRAALEEIEMSERILHKDTGLAICSRIARAVLSKHETKPELSSEQIHAAIMNLDGKKARNNDDKPEAK